MGVENKELNDKVKTVQEEIEALRNQKAVGFMLLLDFKERMRDKYLYNTEDEGENFSRKQKQTQERKT